MAACAGDSGKAVLIFPELRAAGLKRAGDKSAEVVTWEKLWDARNDLAGFFPKFEAARLLAVDRAAGSA